ncbi:MAG: nitroreductase family protein [Armatimonadetes bacterium]|nr:nitroreductase family protein [Armatimonadota bacterium]
MPEFSEVFRTHRSIRKYKSDPIPQALIDEVLEEGIIGASSSGNLNSVSIVLTRDVERKKKLYEFHFEQPMVLEAPLVITFCADWHRTRQWLKMRGARDNFNNLIGYHVALVDAIITAQSVCLGFEARGLGICYMGTTLHSMRNISEFLELPETCVAVTSVVVGYPNEDPQKRDRLPMEAFIHDEKYHDPSPAELEELYRAREVNGWNRYMAFPELKAEIERLGITSLAQFYTSEAKYDPETFIEDSAALEALLREKKFF